MISNEKILKIQECLSEGILSYRDIAKCVNVSRTTVCDVAKGRRVAGKIKRLKQKHRSTKKKSHEYKRCPVCGNKVVWPCLACRVGVVKNTGDVPDGLVLGLDLRAPHRKRYEDIRRQKERTSLYEVIHS